MKRDLKIGISFLGAFAIIFLDRLTKVSALRLQKDFIVNEHLSFSLCFNRGINCGLFHSAAGWHFALINGAIALIILGLLFYTVQSYREKKPLLAPLMILAGALSNFADRILYHGVVDFIVLSWRSWYWPAFNIADMAILTGIALLFVQWYKDK